MSGKIIFIQAKQQFTKRTGKFSQRVSGALTGAAAYSKKNNFAAACIQVTQIALRKADEFTQKVPMPAVVKKHFSKKEVAFIAAAWAIPLPGTGFLAAAIIVGGKHSCRLLRSRLNRRPTLVAVNG